jgi:hypothetical protein
MRNSHATSQGMHASGKEWMLLAAATTHLTRTQTMGSSAITSADAPFIRLPALPSEAGAV